jgi:hypothetical protein
VLFIELLSCLKRHAQPCNTSLDAYGRRCADYLLLLLQLLFQGAQRSEIIFRLLKRREHRYLGNPLPLEQYNLIRRQLFGSDKKDVQPVKPIVREKGRLDVAIRSAGQRFLVLPRRSRSAAPLYDVHALSTQHALDTSELACSDKGTGLVLHLSAFSMHS